MQHLNLIPRTFFVLKVERGAREQLGGAPGSQRDLDAPAHRGLVQRRRPRVERAREEANDRLLRRVEVKREDLLMMHTI